MSTTKGSLPIGSAFQKSNTSTPSFTSKSKTHPKGKPGKGKPGKGGGKNLKGGSKSKGGGPQNTNISNNISSKNTPSGVSNPSNNGKNTGGGISKIRNTFLPNPNARSNTSRVPSTEGGNASSTNVTFTNGSLNQNFNPSSARPTSRGKGNNTSLSRASSVGNNSAIGTARSRFEIGSHFPTAGSQTGLAFDAIGSDEDESPFNNSQGNMHANTNFSTSQNSHWCPPGNQQAFYGSQNLSQNNDQYMSNMSQGSFQNLNQKRATPAQNNGDTSNTSRRSNNTQRSNRSNSQHKMQIQMGMQQMQQQMRENRMAQELQQAKKQKEQLEQQAQLQKQQMQQQASMVSNCFVRFFDIIKS